MLFDNPADLEPESVLNWLKLCAAGLAVEEQETVRLLGAALPFPQALIDELGLGASRDEIAAYFDGCRQELALSAVLTMTAAAEARVRLDASARMGRGTDDLAKRLRVLRAKVELEWEIALYEGGIVDEWKSYLASLTALTDADRARLLTAIGALKSLLRIRHWVAHGRYWQPQRGLEHFAPADVVETIRDLYDAFRQIAAIKNLMTFA